MIENFVFLVLTIYFEARGEEFFDQLAVSHTILNRSKNSSVKEEVLKPKQFSCYNEGIPVPTDIKALFTSAQVALTALSGKDFTDNSLYYHTIAVKPKWRHKVTFVNRFGNHLFYKPLVKIKAERRAIKYENKLANKSGYGAYRVRG